MPKTKKATALKIPEQPLWVRNATKRAMALVWCQTHGWVANRHGHYFAPGMRARLNFSDEADVSYDEKRTYTPDEKVADPLHNSKWVTLKASSYKDLEIGIDKIVFPSDKQNATPTANMSVGADAGKVAKE